MAKHKSPQELMAERNPLGRTAVEPVDIYVEQEELKVTDKTPQISPKQAVAKDNLKETRPYSTYLTDEQVKGIKLRAIESSQKDQRIVQLAINEYFERHKIPDYTVKETKK